MAALFALVATVLTSFLPILNKRILRDARPALVALLFPLRREKQCTYSYSLLLTTNRTCCMLGEKIVANSND